MIKKVTVLVQLLVFSGVVLFFLSGCSSSKVIQPDSPMINRQGDEASIAPLDQTRTASAQTALQADPELGPLHLKVQVFNYTAKLSGTVNSEEQKEKAEKMVRSVPGIKDVENNLIVSH